jgi:hypothetical protein
MKKETIKDLQELKKEFDEKAQEEKLTKDEKIAKDVQMRLNKLFVPPRIDLNDKD